MAFGPKKTHEEGGDDDFESTRRISLYERQQINDEWAKTVNNDLAAPVSMTPASSGDKLQVDADDTPELRSKLNDVNRRYHFVEKFAEGGFGIIYKAKDRALERDVVIKSLRREYIGDSQAAKRFISEAKLNAQLDHPAIVPLYSLDTDAERGLHLAMKYIDGITLKDFLTRLKVKYNLNRITQTMERRALFTRLEYFIKICQAVDYSHGRNIVHCDLKPENIMIGSYGEVYIMDWGTASEPRQSSSGEVEGTPAYLSPETLTHGEVDKSNDIFSLGLVLFELTTLKRAVDGTSVKEITGRIRSGDFEPLSHHVSSIKIAPQLKAIINKAMALDPKDRYQNVNDLAEDIRRYMFHEEVSAKPDSLIQRISRRMYNNRGKTFAALSVLILMLTGLTAFSFYQQSRAMEEASFKIFRHTRLQISTEKQAASIDKYFLHMRNLLTNFSSNLSFALAHGGAYKGKIYSSKDFSDINLAPKDLEYSPAYACKICLSHPVYLVLSEGIDKNYREAVADASMVNDLAIDLLLQSSPDNELTQANRKAMLNNLIRNGTPAKRLYALLGDELLISYPGTEKISGAGRPQNWSWYQQALANRRTTWGSPYIDDTGHIMLPCATPVFNPEGYPLGVAGIDMSFMYVERKIMEGATFKKNDIERYIVNNAGQVVISSVPQNYIFTTGASPKAAALRPFVYNEQLREMKKRNEFQLESVINKSRYVFSYASIPSLDWYFVQVIRLDALMNKNSGDFDLVDKRTFEKLMEYRDGPVKKLLKRYTRQKEESEIEPQSPDDTPDAVTSAAGLPPQPAP